MFKLTPPSIFFFFAAVATALIQVPLFELAVGNVSEEEAVAFILPYAFASGSSVIAAIMWLLRWAESWH